MTEALDKALDQLSQMESHDVERAAFSGAVPLHEHWSKILREEVKCYPSEVNPFGVGITVVLVEGNANDYAAYIGQGTPGYVAKFGNKLSFKEAEVLLGTVLEKEKYRL